MTPAVASGDVGHGERRRDGRTGRRPSAGCRHPHGRGAAVLLAGERWRYRALRGTVGLTGREGANIFSSVNEAPIV